MMRSRDQHGNVIVHAIMYQNTGLPLKLDSRDQNVGVMAKFSAALFGQKFILIISLFIILYWFGISRGSINVATTVQSKKL